MIKTIVYILLLCLFTIISCSEDAPVIIELSDPSIEEVFDIDNLNNASDIRIFINQPGNSEFVREYRVFLVNSNDAVSFSVAQAEGLQPARSAPASSFQTVPATIGQIRLNLSAGLTDIDNNPVINGSSLVVIVMAVGRDSNIASVLSAPSDPFQLADEPLFDIYTSSRDEENIISLLEKTNKIWNQANIYFQLEEIVMTNVDFETVPNVINGNNFEILTNKNFADNKINLFLVQNLNSINGLALGNIHSIFVADYTTVNDFRTTAHELGHLLSLNHVIPQNRLLARGKNGEILLSEEIFTARNNAVNLF